MSTRLSNREMQRAFFGKDASYDGAFVAAVRTTGIFCRPSCPARRPLAQNVAFYATAAEAMRAGYRPCKRCRPIAANGETPEWAARLLARVNRFPQGRIRNFDLKEMGIDPVRARRYFQRRFGVTFQAYCRNRRAGSALQQIREGASVNEAVFANGYESHSGFRAAFAKVHGRTPAACRDAICIWTTTMESPLGTLTLAATPEGICLVEFADRSRIEDHCDALRRHFQCAVVPGQHAWLDQLQDELSDYFAGRLAEFRVPVVSPGTPFQHRVWHALRRIPYGQTWSYERLAREVEAPRASRAAGRANGQNRIAIVIPCHRVVNKDGKLGGYGGGLWRKEWLLNLERRFL